MSKKGNDKITEQPGDIQKIWCPDREGFQYITACLSNCKKKEKCKAFRNYREPQMF
jgi:hypothetical protein